MAERKTLQLYKLEGVLERLEFEHKNACKAVEAVERHIQNFRFSIKLAVIYLILSLIFFGVVPGVIYLMGGRQLITAIYSFIIFISIGLVILAVGAVFHAFSKRGKYSTLKMKKIKAEEAVLEVSHQLNKITLQIDKLKEEIGYEEQQADAKENLEITQEVQRENKHCLKEMLLLQKTRKEKEHQELLRDLENVQIEEVKNNKWMKIYGIQTILSIVLLAMLAILRMYSIGIFTTVFSEVMILLMPWVVIFPLSIQWLSKYLNCLWGEDLWINRVLFSEIHEYSIKARKNKILSEIDRIEKELEENKRKQQAC